MMHRMIGIVWLMLVCGALAACSSGEQASAPTLTPVFTRVSAPSLTAGAAIPAPTGDVVLRVTGRIRSSNVPGQTAVAFDLPTLESLGVVEFRTTDIVTDQQERTFRGVLMRDVLSAVGVEDGATTLAARALDGYSIDIALADPRDYAVLIATQRDGEYLTLETFGPIRTIYPPDTNVDWDERWIWSIAELDVR
jgi:hypothetical protein